MSSAHHLNEFCRASYKPSTNELQIRSEFNELRYGLFKGTVPKIVRMSGQLYTDLKELLTSSGELEEGEEAKLLQRLMRSMDELNKRYVRNSKKKHIFYTGRRIGKLQLFISEHVLPVPHVKGLSVTLITAELHVLGTNDYAFKSARWGLLVDDDMSQEEQNHYVETVSLKDLDHSLNYLEVMSHVIFQVTPYRIK